MKNDYQIKNQVAVIYLRNSRSGSILETLVDAQEIPRLISFRCLWRALWHEDSSSYRVIAHYRDSNGDYKSVFLHRFLTGAPEGLYVDHIDHNPLNNLLSNLRIASTMENSHNRIRPPVTNTSGHICVSWKKREQKWAAQIVVNKKTVWLGYHKTKEEAAKVVEEARAKLMPFSQEALREGRDIIRSATGN